MGFCRVCYPAWCNAVFLPLIIDYRHQEDESIASRGSISLNNATLKYGAENTRFEVQSTPSRGPTSGIEKWYLRANHPVEAARWKQAVAKSIEWYKRSGLECLHPSRRSSESDHSVFRPGKGSFQSAFPVLSGQRMDIGTHSIRGSEGSFADANEAGALTTGDLSGNLAYSRCDSEHELGLNDRSSSSSTRQQPPHELTYGLQANSITEQMELNKDLLSGLPLPPNASWHSSELLTAVKDSCSVLQAMMNDYIRMSREREEWWKFRLHTEYERQLVWEESLQTVVREGETLEKELRAWSRKRGSKTSFVDTPKIANMSMEGRRNSILLPPAVHKDPILDTSTTIPPSQDSGASTASTASVSQPVVLVTPTQQNVLQPRPPTSWESEVSIDTDEEDEFFDAIESNTLPNLVVSELFNSPTHSELTQPHTFNFDSFVEYQQIRTRLPIDKDDRPPISLWSVLKHSIGKDLTKISFPVFFNEPTSMLQRMVGGQHRRCQRYSDHSFQAEDMEFSECRKLILEPSTYVVC